MGYTPKKHKEIKLKLKYASCQTWEDLKYEVPLLLQENAFDAQFYSKVKDTVCLTLLSQQQCYSSYTVKCFDSEYHKYFPRIPGYGIEL